MSEHKELTATKLDPKYSEFENPVSTYNYKDPLDYRFEDTFIDDFDWPAIKYLRHRTSSCVGLNSIPKLRLRVCEHIHMYSFANTCVSLRYLNQKFGLIATRHKTSVRTIIDELESLGKIMAIISGGKTGYFSVAVYNDVSTHRIKCNANTEIPDDFQPASEPIYRDMLISNMIN